MIKKITLPDGSKVGILDLDIILKQVIDLKLVDNVAIKAALLERAREHNYIARGAADDYAVALLAEYEVKLGIAQPRAETHRHTAG